jgi:hypothetical protein
MSGARNTKNSGRETPDKNDSLENTEVDGK